jgi:hypothetical protein
MQKRSSSKPQPKEADSLEPIGIVISRGTRETDTPRFTAYVWGPVPEAELADALVAVA